MKHALTILAALTTLSLPLTCRAEDPAAADVVELSLRFTEGQKLILTTTVEQHTTVTWPTWQSKSNQTTTITMALKVLALDDDGTASIEVTIKSIARKRGRVGWSYDCDPEIPPDKFGRDAPYAAVVGKKFTMQLTPTGQVTELEGYRSMLKAINKAFRYPLRSYEAQRSSILEASRRFGKDGLKHTMEGAFGFLPDEPVAVGATWTRTMAIDYGIPVIADETYTLTERSDGTATITREATLGPQEYIARSDGTLLKSEYEVSGTQKGTLSVDEATGCVLKTTIIQELQGKKLAPAFRAGRGSSAPIASKATITIEVKEPPPEEEVKDVPEAD